jgi:integrase/recombinase XerD
LVVDPNKQTLFLSTLGQQLEPDSLTEYVRRYVESAEIGKKGSCHMFRHTMATLMLENGADIRYIQAMLGHADLRTTQIYTQVSIRKLQQIHKLTHPADLPPTPPEPETPPTDSSQPDASARDNTKENPTDSDPK